MALTAVECRFLPPSNRSHDRFRVPADHLVSGGPHYCGCPLRSPWLNRNDPLPFIIKRLHEKFFLDPIDSFELLGIEQSEIAKQNPPNPAYNNARDNQQDGFDVPHVGEGCNEGKVYRHKEVVHGISALAHRIGHLYASLPLREDRLLFSRHLASPRHPAARP